jgi:hypothetical protein
MAPSSDEFKEDDIGRTRLFHYAATGNKEEVESIIYSLTGTGIGCQRFSLISHKDKLGHTAIDVAKKSGHDEIARLLSGELARIEHYE